MSDIINGGRVIAIAGNPNCGKTVLFNALTGARQHVGNWPGVTVEKKEGSFILDGSTMRVVDLPGTYSLGACSEDEAVARDYILDEKPDAVINVVDSSNMERNLYLTCQLLEMGAPLLLALNMFDEAKAKKIDIDIDKLSKLLGIPVIPTVATKNQGLDNLVRQAASVHPLRNHEALLINYGAEAEECIRELCQLMMKDDLMQDAGNLRWLAVKLLEGDDSVRRLVGKTSHGKELMRLRNSLASRLESVWGDEIESGFAERRYEFVSDIVKETVSIGISDDEMTVSDKIDKVVTNKYLGIPLFLLTMWAVFQFTFTLGNPLADLIDGFFHWSGGIALGWLQAIGAPDLMISLIVEGIIGGVGSVLVFMPNIFLLFFAISILEDSGYMARAAYITDRFMHTLGLHGKSFIPMIVGFGCNVPGILAARTLDNRRDRLVTILINPLMSCSARLPVYILFTGAFFAAKQGMVIFGLYLLGIILAIAMGVIFKKLVFKGETSHFVMELPPYRVPTFKSTFIHMWDRGSSFIKKAGTLIVAVVILVWVLSNLPVGVAYASRQSYLGQLGAWIAPILKPAGFGNWQAAVALLFGVVAKEVIVGTLGVVYGVKDQGLTSMITKAWTPLSAMSFMVMTLIYMPCIATIGAIKRETGSWRWTFFAMGYSLALGWIMAVIVYQFGRLLGFA